MTISLQALQDKVRSQKTLIPSLYGDIDFELTPERFTDDITVESNLSKKMGGQFREQILKDTDAVARARAYTMLGDTVADAYAALLPKHGLQKLISMLKQACDEGIDAVENAPPELCAFIDAMETIPDWVDMDLVEEGGRAFRVSLATLVPFALRGIFIATFMNKYSGLPMTLTGTLSGESSGQRVNETGSFFTTAALPKALTRNGQAFKAAAMVRLMHSMVRFNLLKRSDAWDVETYGIPIPQVDQMPAGTIPAFAVAFRAHRQGRKKFSKRERGIVELCRYQSYLLGLPEELLPDTPEGIVKVMLTYMSTLRDGYDDETCGKLARATITGYRPKDNSLKSRMYNEVEKGFSNVFFTKFFAAANDKPIAKMMGIKTTPKDYLMFGIAGIYIAPRMMFHMWAYRKPRLNKLADKFLIRKIDSLLVSYGHAEYTTDANNYSEGSAKLASKAKNSPVSSQAA